MPLHPSVSYDNFFHWSRGPIEDIDSIWFTPQDVSGEWRKRTAVKGGDYVGDYVTPIDKGKEWMFELTCQHQPRTGAMIMEGGPLFVRNQRYGDGFQSGVMAVEVNGRIVRFFRSSRGNNPSDADYAILNDKPTGYEKSLPDGLGEAYYNRFRGMNLVPESNVSIYSWALPKDASIWRSVDFFLDDYRGAKKKYLPWFNERFPQYTPIDDSLDGNLYYNFRCWLDTRLAYNLIRDLTPAEERARAMNYPVDALFVRQDIVDSPIYHVVDGKLNDMRVLINPAEAVDLYCEHVLLGREERFDFIEHGKPLD
jgi:hypothetical protein